jgi:polyhydroxyalkanoate synthesis regulator phasin
MKEERMKILQMVEDGKITVEEAGKLLESLGVCDECDEENFADKMKEFCKNTEGFLKSVGSKIGDFAKDMEPRVRNVTKTVVSKTADIVEELGKALAACLNSLNNNKAEECGEECCCCCEEDEQEDENKEN